MQKVDTWEELRRWPSFWTRHWPCVLAIFKRLTSPVVPCLPYTPSCSAVAVPHRTLHKSQNHINFLLFGFRFHLAGIELGPSFFLCRYPWERHQKTVSVAQLCVSPRPIITPNKVGRSHRRGPEKIPMEQLPSSCRCRLPHAPFVRDNNFKWDSSQKSKNGPSASFPLIWIIIWMNIQTHILFAIPGM